MFKLNENLKNDTFFVKNLELSQVLLMNNSDFFWIILVPQKEGLTELTDLNFEDQTKLLQEINKISNFIKQKINPDKINIATLGNVVSQLHVHIIARFKNDKAFPAPVWGIEFEKYQQQEAQKLINLISENVN